MPLPVEALRPEKHVGEPGSAAPRPGEVSPEGERKGGVDSAATDRAATVPGSIGAGYPGECVGNCVAARRLVFVPGRRTFLSECGGARGFDWIGATAGGGRSANSTPGAGIRHGSSG